MTPLDKIRYETLPRTVGELNGIMMGMEQEENPNLKGIQHVLIGNIDRLIACKNIVDELINETA